MTEKAHFLTISFIRDFFSQRQFLETLTPPIVENPGLEAHLHPFYVKPILSSSQKQKELYLHTSPEFHMKSLLSQGFQKIYNLGYCFRDEPESETHRPQFLMLEWYRANKNYKSILKDSIELIQFVHQKLRAQNHSVIELEAPIRKTVDELFEELLNFSISDFLDEKKLKRKIISDFPDLTHEGFEDENWPWEDYFYLLFLNEIESKFKQKWPFLIVDEFPAPLAALSTLKKDNPKVCERFEIYLNGIELCNCFNELTDLEIQKKRFKEESHKKKNLYGYELSSPTVLYNALEKGLPPSSGIALGVERLLLGLSKDKINPFFN